MDLLLAETMASEEGRTKTEWAGVHPEESIPTDPVCEEKVVLLETEITSDSHRLLISEEAKTAMTSDEVLDLEDVIVTHTVQVVPPETEIEILSLVPVDQTWVV